MKTTTGRSGEARQGSALVTVMGVILVISVVAASLLGLSRTQARMALHSSDFMRATMIAESGVNAAYNSMRTNFELAGDPSAFPATAFAGGVYDASATVVAANRASITCTGVYGVATARARLDVINIPLVLTNGAPPLDSPYGFAMFVNGYVRLNGSSQMQGSLHANNYIDVNGHLTWGSGTNPVYIEASGAGGFGASGGGAINGTVRAPAVNFAGTITDERVETVPTLPMPSIDLSGYYATAVANGQVYGSTTINSQQDWGTIPGGVRWYNGTLLIKNNGNVKYTGCVIATGDITIKGSTQCSRLGTEPSLISRDGGIEFDGEQETCGLIYAKGDITMNGSGHHQGTIIAGGNVTFNGSASINLAYSFCEPGILSLPNATLDRVYATAWHD